MTTSDHATLRTLLLVVAASLLLTACTTATAAPPVDEPPGPTPTGAADPLPDEPVVTAPIVASWEPGAPPVDLGDGHVIGDCDGDVPALCVSADGTVLGLLEWFRFPAPPSLTGLGGDQLDGALRDFAAARVADLESDRLATCGADHTVLPDAPGGVTVDGQPGLRYGFVTMHGDEVVEHVVSWATVRDGELVMLVAHAATPDGCMASDLTTFPPDALGALLPVLDRVVAGTPLPA